MPRALQLAAVGTAAAALQGIALGFAGFPVVSAGALPERALEVSFAMLQLFVASQLVRRALREERSS